VLTRWYRNSVFYSLDVGLFQDSNDDGIGDLQGLIDRLDYLTRLGVTTLWLNPIHPSPRRDGGYDIIDHLGVHPSYGTIADFAVLLHETDERGIRVMLDLVVNHTSDQHPWFQHARADRNSPFRDLYGWSDTEPPDRFEGTVFPGIENETWTYDQRAQAWYRHRFYRFEPDLNTDNPLVREEICKIALFWQRLGVSGFRLDAAPFLVEPKQRRPAQGPAYGFLHELRESLSWHRGNSVMLAEANVADDELIEYFGNADGNATRVLMVFAFRLNQASCSPSPARMPDPSRPHCANSLSFHSMDNGRPSCAITTRSTSAASPRTNARTSSRHSPPIRTCSFTNGASGAGSPRCWAAIVDGSSWPTACN
jgi:maltose alpha-D-glucosyltransferase / alpha-amylase